MIQASGFANSLWMSEPIHIGSFFSEFSETLPPEIKALQNSDVNNYDLQTMLSVMSTCQTVEQFQEISTYCAEDKLDVPDEPPSLNTHHLTKRHRLFARAKIPPPEICDLATLKHLRQLSSEKDTSRGLKYSTSLFLNNEKNEKHNLQVKKDVIISIRIHDSLNPYEKNTVPVKPFSQEILVLGKQTLADLRDKIICKTDYISTREECEQQVHFEKKRYHRRAKDIFKSGFIFIEDVFYNDFRDPANIDYSEVIRKWAEGKGIGALGEGSMSEMKFEDLTVRFGYPYLYQHQGNCEHLIVFSDASFLHESDVRKSERYPLFKAMGGKKPQECMICYYYAARWITFDNERVPVDPFYFCDECLKSYNYIDKRKIGNFHLYEFHPFLPVSAEKL